MRSIQKAAVGFGALNLVVGVLALAGPLVTRNRDEGINTQPGYLLGVAAVNPPHAILHLSLGALGLASAWVKQIANPTVWLNAVGFTVMALAGWMTVGNRPGIYKVMGFAIDRRDNVLHTLWAAAALVLAARDLNR